MLISSDIASLGKALHSDSPNLETKGIASHRAPVSTINAHRVGDEITHASFSEAVKRAFAAAYPGELSATVVREKDITLPKVWEGFKEIKVSAPVPPNTSPGTGSMGKPQNSPMSSRASCQLGLWWVTALHLTQTAHISSRHALITELIIELDSVMTPEDDLAQDTFEKMGLALKGCRYESLEGAENILGDSAPPDLAWEVLLWLRSTM